jgi:hypothetical protein
MKTHGDLALVALKDDRVVGFTVGSTGDYKKDLMWYALPQLLLGAVAHPGALIRQSRQPNEHASPPPSAEVANNRIMAVAKSANGGGVDLMLAFEAAAERKGLKPYFHDFGSP